MDTIIYRRFSSDEQEHGSTDSLSRQDDACRAMAAKKGWTVTEVLTDAGKSAFKGEHLKGDADLGKFYQRVRAGHYAIGSVLIVERLDRLSRRPVSEAMAWIHEVTSQGVSIALTDSGDVFVANPTMGSFLTTAIQASLSHAESAKKSDLTLKSKNSLWAMAENRTGDWTNLAGKLPSWLSRNASCDGWVIDKERKEVVQSIYGWAADGVGANTITRLLNVKKVQPFGKKGTASPLSRKWGRSTVRQILLSPSVEGDFVPQTGVFVGRMIPGFYPRIVDADIIARARAEMVGRKKEPGTGSRTGHHNLFAGVMLCGECGGHAALSTSVQKGRAYPYIRCGSAGEGRCENKPGYAYKAFESTALDLLLDLALDDRFFAAETDLKRGRIRQAEIQKAILDKRAFRDRLLTTFGDGDDQVLDRIQAAKAEIDGLEAEGALVQAVIDKASGQVDSVEHLKRVGDIREAANSSDDTVRVEARSRIRVALSAIVMRVDIERDPSDVRVFTVILRGGIMAFRIDTKGKIKQAVSDALGRPLSSYLSQENQAALGPLIKRINALAA